MGLGAALAAIVILALPAFALLHTPPGERLLLRWITRAADARIPGRVLARALDLRLDRVALEGVRLEGPDGGGVATIDRLAVDLDVTELLRGKLALDRLEVEGPTLSLRRRGGAWNVRRALGAGEPRPEHRAIAIDAMTLERGTLEVALDEGDPPLRVEDLSATGRLALPAQGALGGHLELAGRIAEPVSRPLALEVELGGTRRAPDAAIQASAGQSALEVEIDSRATGRVTAHLEHLALAGDLIRALVPGAPDTGEVRARGTVALGQDRRHLDVRLRAEAARGGRVVADGRVDLAALGTRPLEAVEGTLNVDVPALPSSRGAIGPIHGDLEIEDATVHVHDLEARLPGLRVEGRGQLDEERVRGSLALKMRSLGRATRALRGLGFGVPELEGAGSATASARGVLDAPSVRVTARLGWLRAGGVTVRGLDADVRSSSEDLTLSARMGEPQRLDVRLAGRWRTPGHELRLTSGTFRYLRATWRLDGAATLAVTAGGAKLRELVLRSGDQVIAVPRAELGDRLAAQVEVADLRLDRLPRALLSRRLEGRVDASLRAGGTIARPQLAGTVVVSGVRAGSLEDVWVAVAGRYADGRARGRLVLRGPAPLRGRFDIPLPPRADASLSLRVEADEVPLRILAALGAPPLEGRAAGTLTLEGTLAAPQLAVELMAERLAIRGAPLGKVRVEARYADGLARAALWSGSQVVARASSHLELRDLLSGRVAPAELPIRGTLRLDALDPGLLAGLHPRLWSAEGRISGTLSVTGTLGAPRALGELQWLDGELVVAPPLSRRVARR